MSPLDTPILVTGATGFIGGRVCERLVQAGAKQVKALVHTLQHAPRIGRLPIELRVGNLLDRQSLRAALHEVQIVIHCGLGPRRGIVTATRNMLEAAQNADIRRFIHISSAAVYGLRPPAGVETESAALRTTGNLYADSKLRAERVVARFASRGFPVISLRPAIVYGPYSSWSTRLIGQLRGGHGVLIDAGEGACNTTYVDNLVDAIILALDAPHVLGENFFITDGERITWGDFIRAHVDMMDPRPQLAQISSSQIEAHYRKQPGLITSSLKAVPKLLLSRGNLFQIPIVQQAHERVWETAGAMNKERRDQLRTLRRKLLGMPLLGGPLSSVWRSVAGIEQVTSVSASNGHAPATPVPDRDSWEEQTGAVFFSIEKARRILGYEPRIPFSEGIRRVEAWLRYAEYL